VWRVSLAENRGRLCRLGRHICRHPEAALRQAPIPFRVALHTAGSSQLSFLPLARKADISLKSACGRTRNSKARRLRSTRQSARRLLRPLVGARDQPQLRAELVRRRSASGDRPSLSFAQSRLARLSMSRWTSTSASYRAVHYAVLLIVITFLTFFLWEHLSGIAIHGMQYLMVGIALALFYLLLLALSEHMAFDLAYACLPGRW
jgi:inner membrane protein